MLIENFTQKKDKHFHLVKLVLVILNLRKKQLLFSGTIRITVVRLN